MLEYTHIHTVIYLNTKVFRFIFFVFLIQQTLNQLNNKMFSPTHPHRQQILRLPQSSHPQTLLRMCTSQQMPRDQPINPYPRPQPKQKISIKRQLKKRQFNTQSCASFSQVSEQFVQYDPRMAPTNSRMNPVGYLNGSQRMQNVQNNNAFNYIFGECVIKPQQMRIIYHNSPLSRTNNIPITNQTNFNYPQHQKLTPAKDYYNPEITQTQPTTIPKTHKIEEKQTKKEKQETFNEFMSFGPKHFDLFKNMEELSINQITSHIIEETQRTDLDGQSQCNKKRLTKTFSQAKIKSERDRFATVSQLQGKSPFARSNLFRSIKKTETMGGKDENSDHESEVVEKFESLMQKVRENRLDNSIIDF